MHPLSQTLPPTFRDALSRSLGGTDLYEIYGRGNEENETNGLGPAALSVKDEDLRPHLS